MATNFPASLDTLTNPTSSDSLSSPSHSAQHANVNDAVEAIETALLDGAPLHIDDANERVGVGNVSPSYKLDVTGDINASGDLRIGGTAVGAWTSFTPTWLNLTQGNGTVGYAKYSQINKTVHFVVSFTWGSTTSLSGHWGMQLPVTGRAESLGVHSLLLSDWGTTVYWGRSVMANATDVYFYSDKVLSSNYVYYEAVSATLPFTWTGTVSDAILFSGTYEAA